ncbi:MAG: hypothetical protein CMH49_04640 [Myxococcales bacterium]|nr:hypothetical protein [Myxococcales bacterium]
MMNKVAKQCSKSTYHFTLTLFIYMERTLRFGIHTIRFTLSLVLISSFSFGPGLFSSTVSAQKTEASPVLTVRYSYEKQSKLGVSRYVLVPTVQKVNGSDYAEPKKRFKALFMSMKKNKKSNYGKTGYNYDDGVVLVFLDAEKERNFRFIMAEAVYTFTENGAKAVRFPKSKFSGRDYTRIDVELPSYRLILPYWEGLPPQQSQGALLSIGDGSLLTADALKVKLDKGDSDLISHLVATLKKGDEKAVASIVAAHKLNKLKGIEIGFIPLLQSAQVKLRELAVEGLMGIESKEVFKALREVMDSDPEANIKDKAALALSKAKDPKVAAAALYHNLRSTDAKVALVAAEKLVKIKGNEADQELLVAIKRTEANVRSMAIKSLVSRKTIKPLIKQLNAELEIDVKVEIAQAIRNQKSARKSAYNFLVTQPNGEAVLEALEAIKSEKLKGDIATWFEKGLRHPNANTRIKTAQLLEKSQGVKALKLLAKADIDDAESGELIHESIRNIYAEQSAKIILNDSARASSVSLKSAATGVLGQLYQKANVKTKKKAFKAVGQLAQSSKAWIRAEAARSLGDIKGEEARKALIKLKDDADVKVKRAVARSASAFAEDKMRSILLGYLKEKDDRIIEYSLISLGQLKSKETLSAFFNETYLAHKSTPVRKAAMGAVAEITSVLGNEKREALTTRINLRLAADSDSETRIAGAKALSFIPTEESRVALSTQLQDKDVAFVKSIVDALITHAVPASIQLLEGAMDHRESSVRTYAYKQASALEAAGLKKVVKGLFERRLKIEDNKELKEFLNSSIKSL